MKRKEAYRDSRVKRRIFPVSTFIAAWVVIAVLATLQLQALNEYFDYRHLPTRNALAVLVIWIVIAVLFTLWINYHIHKHYQRPVEEVSEAARKVAAGDFSPALTPHHEGDKTDQLDVLFTDFNRMVEELRSTEILKSDFIANVSHEFKAPLSVIKSSAEMLKAEDLPEGERQRHLKNITDASDRMTGLITNMLRLNKLENQSIQPERKPFDLSRQLEECLLQFEQAWDEKQLDVQVIIDSKCEIVSDAELLRLVWVNLLSNAVKFTPVGGNVSLRMEPKGDAVAVTIADTGRGMDQETLKRMYDKFYQGDSSHATEGNGLGLALVHRIITMLGGTITAESSPGQGTVFTVTLRINNSET